MQTIEDIILQRDQRGVSALRPYLPPDYCTQAAQYVLDHPGTTIITTGFYILYGNAIETDGPPGAIAIGVALQALGHKVIYLTDQHCLPVMESLAENKAEVLEFPITDLDASQEFAKKTLSRLEPSLIISIERCSPSADGTYRNMRSMDVSDYTAKVDTLFGSCPSVGIGDGGNEIGMGLLRKQILNHPELHPNPATVPCDRLIISSCSNWGGWGLVAALSNLNGRNLLPTLGDERERVNNCVNMGAVDGFTGTAKPYVDGFPMNEYTQPLAQLHDLVAV